MDLSIAYNETVDISEEPTFGTLKKFPGKMRTKATMQCEICCKTFSQMGSLKMHIKTVHEKKKTFKCDNCDYSCSHTNSMTRHVESVHEKKKQFKCEICDYLQL